MKTLIAILSAIAALAAVLAGLDVNGIVTLLPPKVAAVLVGVPSTAAFVVHLANAIKAQLAKASEEIDRMFPPHVDEPPRLAQRSDERGTFPTQGRIPQIAAFRAWNGDRRFWMKSPRGIAHASHLRTVAKGLTA